MKKNLLLFAIFFLSHWASGIRIKFVAWGATDKIDRIVIKNLSRNTPEIQLLGSEDLTLGGINEVVSFAIRPSRNPFLGQTTLSYYASGEPTTVDVYDVMGKQVASSQIGIDSGIQSFDFIASKAGCYFLKVTSGSSSSSVKLICHGSSNSTCKIVKNGASTLSPIFRKPQVDLSMPDFHFVAGDWLEYTCYSGDRIVTYYDSPTHDNTIKFFFDSKSKIERLAWWREAKLGLFIHWGIYSALQGEWNGQLTKPTGVGAEWIKRLLNIPSDEYNKYLNQFTASQFSAQAIVDLAKRNGLKYVVITVKHHDGFILFPSEVSDYNITKTPANPHIIKELADACRGVGLKFGVYYSQNMDWTHRGGLDYNDGNGVHVNNGKGWTLAEKYDYITNNSIPVLEEIFQRFDPDILWYDTPWVCNNPAWAQLIQNKVDEISQGKVVVNDRLHELFPNDFDTPEGGWTKEGRADNEICFTMNGSWGYDKHSTSYITPHSLLYKIVESASRGGNSLVNIGPKADGSIPQKQIELLDKVGEWFRINASSLYGSSIALPSTHQSLGRLTQKQDTIFAIILKPNPRSVHLDGIKNSNIIQVTDLHGNSYSWTNLSDETTVISEIKPSTTGLFTVLKIVFDGPIQKTDRLSLNFKTSIFHALCFKATSGGTVSFHPNNVYLGSWNSKTLFKTKIFNNFETGKYKVYLKVKGGDYTSLVRLKVNDQEYQGVELNLPWNYNWEDYTHRYIQTIHLEKGEEYIFHLYKVGQGQYLNIEEIKFEKIE